MEHKVLPIFFSFLFELGDFEDFSYSYTRTMGAGSNISIGA